MQIFHDVRRLATVYLNRLARWQTERAIGALPSEMRKDIGWPSAEQVQRICGKLACRI